MDPRVDMTEPCFTTDVVGIVAAEQAEHKPAEPANAEIALATAQGGPFAAAAPSARTPSARDLGASTPRRADPAAGELESQCGLIKILKNTGGNSWQGNSLAGLCV